MLSNDDMINEILCRPRTDKKFIPGETYIQVSGQVFDNQEVANLVKVALSEWYAEGRVTKEFTTGLRAFLRGRSRFAIPTGSGSSANLLAISAIKQKEFGHRAAQLGDEVITAAVGFPTTVAGIVQNGLVPVFIDVDFPTYNINVEDIEEAITEKTKAIMVAHTLGNPFNLDAVKTIADEYNLFLIEDSCDSLGSTYGGELCGTIGDMGTLSFYPAHHLTTGEGGMVLCNSPMVAKVVESLRSWGRDCWCVPGKDNTCGKRFSHEYENLPYGYDHKYVYSRLGYNLKFTDMQASIGLAQLQKLPQFIEKRKHNWKRLHDGFKQFEHYFMLPEATKNSDPSWFGFALTVGKSANFTRHELVTYLEQHKIGTRMLFGGNLLHQPGFQGIEYKQQGKRLYNSDIVTEHTFWLGVYPGITDEMTDYVLNTVDCFIRERR